MRFVAFYAAALLLSPAVLAQQTSASATPITDTDIQLIRSDVQSDKNVVIAHTMQFTDPESAAFWPLYREYVRDQQSIGDKRVQLIKDYATWADTLDEAKANDLVQRSIALDDETSKLRQTYWPKFAKALGAKRAMKFYQVDNRLSLIINVQLTAGIPLIP
jgi:Spy/CpxP family protein refolding chaperone